jgi:hypothetical protein
LLVLGETLAVITFFAELVWQKTKKFRKWPQRAILLELSPIVLYSLTFPTENTGF